VLGAAITLMAIGAQVAWAAPSNDNFGSAVPLATGVPAASTGHTTLGGTRESGEVAGTGPNSVWFNWDSGGVSGLIEIDACAGNGDAGGTELHLWTGNAVNALAEVGFSGIGDNSCEQRFRINSSTTYRISVGNLNPGGNPGTNFDIALSQYTSGPANDDYADALPVGPALPIGVTSTTEGGTSEPGEPAGLGGNVARSVWFSWMAPSNAEVRVDACDFSSNVTVGVYTVAGSLGAATELAVTPFTQCSLVFTPAQGTTYRIAVAGFATPGLPNFTLRIRGTAPPANDMYGNATTLPGTNPVSLAGDNTFATTQANEPSGEVVGGVNSDVHRSVWYRWTAPATETVRISACPTDPTQSYTARLGVYEEEVNETLTVGQLAANVVGHDPGFGPYCRKKVDVTAGRDYVIELASDSSANNEGPFLVEIHTFDPPDNDHFIAAEPLGSALPVSATGSNMDASVEPDEQDADFGSSNATVWYRWTAPATQIVRLEICDVGFAVMPSIWTGTEVGSLSEVEPASFDDCASGFYGAQATFTATAGTEYRFRIGDDFNDEEGTFSLRLVDPNAQPPGAGPQPPIPQPPPRLSAKAKCKKIKSKKKRKKCLKKAKKKKRKK
jgi:hypothetical protein